jgi:hypothetical protein
MDAENVSLMTRSTLLADSSRAMLVCFLLILLLSLPVSAQTKKQGGAKPGRVQVFRHHVIFLLDASASIPVRPGSEEQYLSVIRNDLPALLSDAAKNGFGISIYDQSQDLSSVFAFGLSQQRPVFSPSTEYGFMRRLWFQEKGKTYDDIVRVAPAFNQHWTAINSAFIQSVRKARWEAEQLGVLDRAFDRTFIVVITDGRSNTSRDSLDEIQNIYGAAVTESDLGPGELQSDFRAAQSYYGQLTNLFALSPSDPDNPVMSTGSFEVGNYKVFIRELRPQKLVNLGDLLEKGPDQETELSRRANRRYVGTLTVIPHQADSQKEISYELVDIKYRLPGQTDYRTATPSSQPFVQEVNVSGDKIDDATADFQLSFVRRDPIYGQSVQVFKQQIRFRREPTKYVLWVIPITDLLMSLHPSAMTQDQIQVLDSLLIGAAFVFLLYMLLVPPPRAEMELVDGSKNPFEVTFKRAGQESGQLLLLRSLRFKNTALRRIFGRALPRLAERPFDIELKIQSEFPSSVVLATDPVVGIGKDMLQEHSLTKQTQGSETALQFSPDGLADYVGANTDPVKCELTVYAFQRGRRFRIVPFSRKLEPQKHTYYVKFKQEEPDMKLSLEPHLEEKYTGTTETTPFSEKKELAGDIKWPHARGRRDQENADPEFYLQIWNAATHHCSTSGFAKLSIVVYRVDRKGETVALLLDAPYRDVIQVDPHKEAVKIPVWMPYEELPPPASSNGDDYIVEATLTAVEGQPWGSQKIKYGVRVGPDERTTALSFRVGTSDESAGNELRWQSFGSPANGQVLSVTASKRVLWNIGRVKEKDVFARIAIDNVARLGEGAVTMKLKPQAEVRIHPSSDPGSEPEYTDAKKHKNKIVSVGSHPVGSTVEWRIENESTTRPVFLNLQFQPDEIVSMQRRPPYFDYVCYLPFECTLHTKGQPDQSFVFNLEVNFCVQRYAGEYALAVDFGTSAVVAAFEQDEQKILNRYKDVSYATENLQRRYRDLVKDWQHSPERDLRDAFDYETADPNMERDTVFIPSALMMRGDKEIGEADFVTLPVSLTQMSQAWDRTIYYLKGLILRGDQYLEYRQVEGIRPFRWKDKAHGVRLATQDPIPVDEIIRSAYRNLLDGYVKPLLKKDNKEDYFERLIVSHPNNFTVSHIHRITKILTETFPELRIALLSESNAVAIYCAFNSTRFFRKPPQPGESRHLLVYDIGAGTADLTYTRLTWGSVEGASVLKEMRILFKAGVPVAGNRLDACLARILDEKIKSFVGPLRDQNIGFEYDGRIVDPDVGTFNPTLYAARMLIIKKILHDLKVEISEHEKPLYQVPVPAAQAMRKRILNVTKLDATQYQNDELLVKKLAEFGISYIRDHSVGIPLTRVELFEHREVAHWLSQITSELTENLKGALDVLGLKPEVDTLIVSGRTSQFPPLREQLFKAIKETLGLEASAYYAPRLEHNENKEAVVLGSLMHMIASDRNLRVIDRNVWAKYGVIYNDGTKRRFQEFFSYASEILPGDEEIEVDGMRVVFFNRTMVITRAHGPIEIAATSCHDPDAALRDFQTYLDRFQVLHTFGNRQLGPAGKVKIKISNNRDDTITVVLDPDRFPKTINVSGYRQDAHMVQLEWPYQPLTSRTALH